MKKAIRILICFLCIAISIPSFLGCNEFYYEETALPHYDYSDGDGKSYNTELFYNITTVGLGYHYVNFGQRTLISPLLFNIYVDDLWRELIINIYASYEIITQLLCMKYT